MHGTNEQNYIINSATQTAPKIISTSKCKLTQWPSLKAYFAQGITYQQ